MSEENPTPRKPRLWLRLLLVLLIVGAVVAGLGYEKFQQIQVQIAQGSQQPPPTSVTVASAEPAEWSRQVKAIGTLQDGEHPTPRDMFEQVFAEMPPHLVRQRQEAGY